LQDLQAVSSVKWKFTKKKNIHFVVGIERAHSSRRFTCNQSTEESVYDYDHMHISNLYLPNTLRFWIDMCIVRVSCCIDWPLTIPLDDRTFGYWNWTSKSGQERRELGRDEIWRAVLRLYYKYLYNTLQYILLRTEMKIIWDQSKRSVD